jgi:Uma2 family endonuclease
MPTIAPQSESSLSAPFRIVWTRDDCENLERDGYLDLGKYELIEGSIIPKMPQKRPHINTVIAVQYALIPLFGERQVQSQGTIDILPEDNPTSEPEPDVTVLKSPATDFSTNNPRPSDIHLVVEISDSTLRFDLGTKANLYARAEIVEYWVIDVNTRQLHVHRDPMGGTYQSVTVLGEQDNVILLAKPNDSIPVRELLA